MKTTAILLTVTIAAVVLFLRVDGKGYREAEREVASSLNDFGWKVYKELSESPGNLLFSPLSLDTVLAMVWEGARGRTADEIADILGLPSNAKTLSRGYQALMRDLNKSQVNATVKIANKLFTNANTQLKPAYKNYVERYFLSEAQGLDFASKEAKNTINKWVESKTNKKIKDIIESLQPQASMVMVNALYFKGMWSSPFDVFDSLDGVFRVTNTLKKKVTFMSKKNNFGYAEDDDLQFLKMDYEGGYSMLVILPKEKGGLRQLEDALINLDWKEIEDTIQLKKVSVTFPKFTIESKFYLIDPLKKMGLKSLFEGEANLAGISDNSLHISDVVQKTFINVTEKGTEAAAATGLKLMGMSIFTEDIPEFRADHPFIFVLRHQGSGVNLFVGRVLEP